MKAIILFLSSFCLTTIGQSQNTWVKFDRTVYLDDTTVVSVEQLDLKAPPPSDPDFSIIDDNWVNYIMKDWEYWDGAFKDHQTTLFITNSGKTAADSVLVAENADNRFTFRKVGAKWLVENFTIRSTNITLNHVSCGQTSKEVFKILNRKIKKQVGDGHVFLSNANGSYEFTLTFVKDKLVCIQL